MKSPIDRLPKICITLSCCFALFMVFVWSPILNLWFYPWWYEGLALGSQAFRRAFTIGAWIGFAPIMVFIGVLVWVISRALTLEEHYQQAERDKRQARYTPVTLEAIRDDRLNP